MTHHAASHLIIVPGHGVCKSECTSPSLALLDTSWVGIFPGEAPFYIEHIRAGIELAAADESSLLVFSGGQTREAAGPRSEAESYFEIAREANWWGHPHPARRVLKEEYARDSLENLLFSVALFIQHTSRWPQRITVAGWRFKAERFDLHRTALQIPAEQFNYVGVNNPAESALEEAIKGEQNKLEAVRRDLSLSRKEAELAEILITERRNLQDVRQSLSLSRKEWQQQRMLRNPFERQHPYYGIDEQLDASLRQMQIEEYVDREEKFQKELGSLLDEVEWIRTHYDACRQILVYARKAEKKDEYDAAIRSHPSFWNWTLQAHYNSAIIGLCRIYDTNRESLNLTKFLKCIQASSHWFKDENFKKRLQNDPEVDVSDVDVSIGNTKRKRDGVAKQVEEDLKYINEDRSVKSLNAWRDKVIVHKDRRVISNYEDLLKNYPLSVNQVGRLIKKAEKMLDYYNYAYRARGSDFRFSAVNSELKGIFEIAKKGIEKIQEDKQRVLDEIQR